MIPKKIKYILHYAQATVQRQANQPAPCSPNKTTTMPDSHTKHNMVLQASKLIRYSQSPSHLQVIYTVELGRNQCCKPSLLLMKSFNKTEAPFFYP